MGYLLLCLKIQNGESNMAAKTAFLSHFKEFERLYSNKLGKLYIYYFYSCLSIAVCVIYLKVPNGESDMAAKSAFLSLFKELEKLSYCKLLIFYLYYYNSCLLFGLSIIMFENLKW